MAFASGNTPNNGNMRHYRFILFLTFFFDISFIFQLSSYWFPFGKTERTCPSALSNNIFSWVLKFIIFNFFCFITSFVNKLFLLLDDFWLEIIASKFIMLYAFSFNSYNVFTKGKTSIIDTFVPGLPVLIFVRMEYSKFRSSM